MHVPFFGEGITVRFVPSPDSLSKSGKPDGAKTEQLIIWRVCPN